MPWWRLRSRKVAISDHARSMNRGKTDCQIRSIINGCQFGGFHLGSCTSMIRGKREMVEGNHLGSCTRHDPRKEGNFAKIILLGSHLQLHERRKRREEIECKGGATTICSAPLKLGSSWDGEEKMVPSRIMHKARSEERGNSKGIHLELCRWHNLRKSSCVAISNYATRHDPREVIAGKVPSRIMNAT